MVSGVVDGVPIFMIADSKEPESQVHRHEELGVGADLQQAAPQQLDVAVPPEFRSKPKRKMIVIVAGLLSLAFTLFWVFGAEYYRQVREKDGKLESVLRYFQSDFNKAKQLLRRK